MTSEHEITCNVAFGYLSVLLSHLSLSQMVKERVCSQLQGGTLKQLLDAVEEFIKYHRQVEDEIFQVDRGVDLKAGFVCRLQTLVEHLQQGEMAA